MSDNGNDDTEIDPLKIASNLSESMASLENIKEREKLVSYYKDKFVAQRLKISSEAEQLRLKALEKLAEQLDNKNLPVTMLLKIIEVLSKGGEADLSSLNKAGLNINLGDTNNNLGTVVQGTLVQEEDHTLKKIGHTLEALKAISSTADMNKIKNIKESIDIDFTEIKPDE